MLELSGQKRKEVLLEFTKDMVTQGTQVIELGDDDIVNSEELILNVYRGPNYYTEVTDFLKWVRNF